MTTERIMIHSSDAENAQQKNIHIQMALINYKNHTPENLSFGMCRATGTGLVQRRANEFLRTKFFGPKLYTSELPVLDASECFSFTEKLFSSICSMADFLSA